MVWCCQQSKSKDRWPKQRIIGRFSQRFVGSLFLSILVLIVGTINASGADIRVYLTAFNNDYVHFLSFNQSPLIGAILHIIVFSVASLLGGLLHFEFVRINMKEKIQNQSVKFSQNVIHHPKVESFFASKTSRWAILGIALLAAFFLPRTWGSYWNYTLGTVGIYIILGIGLNIIVGLSGQLVLGYVAFYAIGAYTFGLLTAPLPHAIQMNFCWLCLLPFLLQLLPEFYWDYPF